MSSNTPHLRLVASSPEEDRRLLNPSGEPLRVLVVEDDGMVAQTLTDIIEHAGGKVAGMITSGLASAGAASGIRLDVIVMDVGLPGMDGIDAAAIIRARYPVPIVFISGQDIRAEVNHRLGETDRIATLVKPIDPKTLCDAILRVYAREATK